MACVDTDGLNALIPGAADGPTVTVDFGAYMNWGRWNHNTSRIQPLIDGLTGKGVNVQLKHDAEETTWESHGWAAVSIDGEEIAREETVQHNRGWGERTEKLAAMVEAVIAALAEKKASGGAVAAAS